jgi:hypothetical protein
VTFAIFFSVAQPQSSTFCEDLSYCWKHLLLQGSDAAIFFIHLPLPFCHVAFFHVPNGTGETADFHCLDTCVLAGVCLSIFVAQVHLISLEHMSQAHI